MTNEAYEKEIARLGRVYRIIMAEAMDGPVSAPALCMTTGRRDGLTQELTRLLQMGFLRRIGHINTGRPGSHPMHYERVPAHQVEEEREAWAKLLASRKKKKKRSLASRIPELEQKAREQGDYSQFYRTRVRIIQMATVAKQIGKMAFWDAAPRDDLARVADELIEVMDACAFALEQLVVRADDDELANRIEKMLQENGRGELEMASFRVGAARLKKRLLPVRNARPVAS